jgi:hypothetical protein
MNCYVSDAEAQTIMRFFHHHRVAARLERKGRRSLNAKESREYEQAVRIRDALRPAVTAINSRSLH